MPNSLLAQMDLSWLTREWITWLVLGFVAVHVLRGLWILLGHEILRALIDYDKKREREELALTQKYARMGLGGAHVMIFRPEPCKKKWRPWRGERLGRCVFSVLLLPLTIVMAPIIFTLIYFDLSASGLDRWGCRLLGGSTFERFMQDRCERQ